MKMEQTECSETSAYKIHAGQLPKRKHTRHTMFPAPYKGQHKPHFTAQHVIEIAFCEQHSQQSCTVHRHGEQVHELLGSFLCECMMRTELYSRVSLSHNAQLNIIF